MHPDERQWAKDNAKAFAKFYERHTDKSITEEQAQKILLANGYRLVDAVASKGPGGDAAAVAYINGKGKGLFRATPEEYNNPFLYGNKDGSLTPEQKALPGAVANPKAGLVIVGGLVTAGLAPEIVAGLASIPGAPIFSAGGAMGSAALASPVGTGAISAGINAGSQYFQNGSINPVDVAGAFGAGVAGSYGGLLWNMGVNAGAGATTTMLNNLLQGKNDSVIGAGVAGGLFSSIGYGVGKVAGDAINSTMKPTINNSASWANSGAWYGSGYNIFMPKNTAAIGATSLGGATQEGVQSMFSNMKNQRKAK